MTTTVAIEQDSVNKVKAYIIGKGFSIGDFYAQAAKEKIEKEECSTNHNIVPQKHEDKE